MYLSLFKKCHQPVKYIRALALFFLFFSQLSFAAFSNQEQLKFKHLSINDGLSQSYAYSITQDAEGFIWVATEDGLNKYDGENFTQYRHNNTDPSSVADNFIRKVFVDNNNTLWVGTQNGLSRYDNVHDNFESFTNVNGDNSSLKDNVIWDIYQDNAGKIWVSTQSGLHIFNKDKKNFNRVHVEGLDEQLTEIKTIFQDSNENFWLGTFENGIFLANSDVTTAVALRNDNNWGLTLKANTLNDMQKTGQYYWLATDNGAYVISKEYKIHKHYTVNNTPNSLISNKVRNIEHLSGSKFFIATEDGLNIIDLHTDKVSTHVSKSHPKAISENWILDIFKDSSGVFWFGTYGKGVNVFNPVALKFQHKLYDIESNMIDAFTETPDGNVWFSSQTSGLNYITPNNSIITSPTQIDDSIFQMQAGSDNNIWMISLSGSMYNFSSKDYKYKEITQWKEKSNYDNNYLFIVLDNLIWFIDNNGKLASFDSKSNKFKTYISPNNDKFKGLTKDNGNIWLVSQKHKTFKFNIESKTFIASSSSRLNSSNLGTVTNIVINKHWVWLLSDQGIILFNEKNNTTTVFDENNNLSNNYIASLLTDENDNAWVATNRSISVINPNTNTVQNFDNSFTNSDNELLKNSALRSKKGNFYFGGINGFYQFKPDEVLKVEQKFSSPIFTKLLIANKEIKVKSSPKNKKNTFSINKQLNSINKLVLKHQQSPFSLEFISPNARLPEQIRYRYKLKGLEENWIESGIDNRRATYTNLSPGNYTFEVQVYDIHQPNELKTHSININILPPWWLSSSAIVVYTLVFLLVVVYILQQLRHKRLYHLHIKQSEERLKLSLWGSGDEMWDWNIVTGRIYRSNIWGILEFPQDGRRNGGLNEDGTEKTNIHPHDIPRVKQALTDHVESDSELFEVTYRVKNKNNQWIWVLDRGKVVERDENDKPTRMTGTLKDISQIKKAEESLKLFAKCIENISDAVVIYNRQFNVVDVNKAYQRITQKTKSSMIGKQLNFSRYSEQFTLNVKKHLITKGSWHGEIESYRGNNEAYLTDLNIDIIRDENNNISHFVGVFSDITKRKETEAELRKLASSDTLTGLPNRSYFQANQTRLVRSKIPHALLVFDLDNFKKINDSMGHEVGDILLCKVAERILTIGRKQDTVYRLGGDEFSLIIENTNDIHTITSIAKEILRTVAQPFKLKNQEVVLYSSIGIVLYPEDGVSSQELLKNADTAMYHAKDSGGNKYQFFNESMNKKAVKRLQVENLIRHGLKEDLFSVFYQPKIEISTGKIAGMEALVRFETPNKGIISPLTFIPVSEETGQIIDIGETVLRKSCFATKRWVDEKLFDGRIAVNLSAVQFTQPNLVEMIKDILRESQLPAKYLELEITEGTVMDSPQQAIDTMLQIRKMGIHLSLDDFGTGYSSLAYLKKFPLNTLKIDKAFVDDIEHSEQGRNMVATIVTIAHNLDLQVVAEGVETNHQLSFLAGLRCEQLQGYLYSKPLPETDFKKYLISHQITDKSTSFSKR
ncbi:EAL domain-containing protein [Thalassotalea sp. PLHSN55]|uniref:EAL domain-containing protein n=1 Tax=Thalassotalea sp. PLHSN55 TaxID=3435888 RepID=UPI003F849EB1